MDKFSDHASLDIFRQISPFHIRLDVEATEQYRPEQCRDVRNLRDMMNQLPVLPTRRKLTKNDGDIYPRDAMLARYLCHRMSVCLSIRSVTSRYCIKTVKRSILKTTPPDDSGNSFYDAKVF